MSKEILATVGDTEITKEQMVSIMRNIPQEHAQTVAGEEGRMRLLEEMIAGELLYKDAVSAGMESDDEFKSILEEAKKGLLQRYAVNKLFDGIEIAEEEIEAFYNENSEAFKVGEQAKASHILVDNEELANEIMAKITDGEDFGEMAKESSTCPSKERGGDLGTFAKGQMVPEFEEAVFAAEAGQVVGPVKTQFGFHIIRVDELMPASVQPMEAVEGNIRQELVAVKQRQVYDDKVEALKEVHEVTVHPEALK